MKKKTVKKLSGVMTLAMVLLLSACGSDNSETSNLSASESGVQQRADTQSTQNAETETSVGENQADGSYTISFDTLYDDNEEMVAFVPVNLVGGSYAELMMQVTGYTYRLMLVDDTTYELLYTYECGTPGEDTSMYLKRVLTFTGSYSQNSSDSYLLEKPIRMTFEQESAGQFAAESGEGGADMWGPDGLKFDETYENEEGYTALGTGSQYLEHMAKCIVTVDDSNIVSFENAEENAEESAEENAEESAEENAEESAGESAEENTEESAAE